MKRYDVLKSMCFVFVLLAVTLVNVQKVTAQVTDPGSFVVHWKGEDYEAAACLKIDWEENGRLREWRGYYMDQKAELTVTESDGRTTLLRVKDGFVTKKPPRGRRNSEVGLLLWPGESVTVKGGLAFIFYNYTSPNCGSRSRGAVIIGGEHSFHTVGKYLTLPYQCDYYMRLGKEDMVRILNDGKKSDNEQKVTFTIGYFTGGGCAGKAGCVGESVRGTLDIFEDAFSDMFR